MKKIMIFGGIGLVVVIGIVLVLMFGVFKSDDGEEVEKDLPEITFVVDEQYANIGTDEVGRTKIIKLQMSIIYTNDEFTKLLTDKKDDIKDYLNGYFRDTTVEAVNRKNGKERVKEEILDYLMEMFETDSDNFKRVIFPQFIIQ